MPSACLLGMTSTLFPIFFTKLSPVSRSSPAPNIFKDIDIENFNVQTFRLGKKSVVYQRSLAKMLWLGSQSMFSEFTGCIELHSVLHDEYDMAERGSILDTSLVSRAKETMTTFVFRSFIFIAM